MKVIQVKHAASKSAYVRQGVFSSDWSGPINFTGGSMIMTSDMLIIRTKVQISSINPFIIWDNDWHTILTARLDLPST